GEPDDVAAMDGSAGAGGHPAQVGVGGAAATRVLDPDGSGSAHPAGEGHDAVAGGPYGRPGPGGVVEAEVPGAEWPLRRLVTPDDGPLDRRGPLLLGLRRGSRGRRTEGHEHDTDS